MPVIKKKGLLFLLTIFMVIILFSCRKDNRKENFDVTIIEPVYNNLYYSPGIMHVHIHVESKTVMRSIKLNITNDKYISIFNDLIYTCNSNIFDKELDYKIISKTVNENAVYYFHVFAQGVSGTKNKYKKIRIKNQIPQFNGVILFSENNNGKTEFVLHKNETDSVLLQKNGQFIGSGFSLERNMMFVLQNQYPTLIAYLVKDMSLQWQYSPQTISKFTQIKTDVSENIIYLGSSEGALLGFNMQTGIMCFSTPFMKDTIPQIIALSKDYVFGVFKTSLGGKNLWAAFYKNSGIPIFRRSVFDSTFSVFDNDTTNIITIFANNSTGSVRVKFNIADNKIISKKNIISTPAISAIKMADKDFLLETKQRLYYFTNGFLQILNYSYTNVPVVITYDHISKHLYIVENHKLLVFKWPDFYQPENQEYLSTLKGIQILYTYNE